MQRSAKCYHRFMVVATSCLQYRHRIIRLIHSTDNEHFALESTTNRLHYEEHILLSKTEINIRRPAIREDGGSSSRDASTSARLRQSLYENNSHTQLKTLHYHWSYRADTRWLLDNIWLRDCKRQLIELGTRNDLSERVSHEGFYFFRRFNIRRKTKRLIATTLKRVDNHRRAIKRLNNTDTFCLIWMNRFSPLKITITLFCSHLAWVFIGAVSRYSPSLAPNHRSSIHWRKLLWARPIESLHPRS